MNAANQNSNVSPIFENLSAHLDRLAEQISDVEEALGASLAEDAATTPVSITRFQSLDFIRQSLEDCALLVHYLNTSSARYDISPSSISIIEAKLKLDVTKTILQPKYIEVSNQEPCSKGELDLF